MTKYVDYDFWLKFGVNGSISLTINKPSKVASHERTLNCAMKVPVSLFSTPQLKASIVLEDSGQMVDIDLEQVQAVMKDQLGVEVEISVKE